MHNTAALLIGQDIVGQPSDLFGGKIDDARVYSRALSAAEMTTLYNYGIGGGGGGCTGPAGNETDIMYNNDYNVIQYCDGAHWRHSR